LGRFIAFASYSADTFVFSPRFFRVPKGHGLAGTIGPLSSFSMSPPGVHPFLSPDSISFLLSSPSKPVLLLDGGTGEELFSCRHGVPYDNKIWSARAVVDPSHHETLKNVHASFLNAGAHGISTNTYGIVPGVGFVEKSERGRLINVAGSIARSVSDGFSSDDSSSLYAAPLVFGSLGPLVESYVPESALPHDEGVECYVTAVDSLASYVDVFLAETMGSTAEAAQVMEAVASSAPGRPMMVSYTLGPDGILRSRETAERAVQSTLNRGKDLGLRLVAVCFNCSTPESISVALSSLSKEIRLRMEKEQVLLGAYANALTPIDEDWRKENNGEPQPSRVISEEDYGNFVKTWIEDMGVRIIGGCCGFTPDHIKYLAKHLKLLNK